MEKRVPQLHCLRISSKINLSSKYSFNTLLLSFSHATVTIQTLASSLVIVRLYLTCVRAKGI